MTTQRQRLRLVAAAVLATLALRLAIKTIPASRTQPALSSPVGHQPHRRPEVKSAAPDAVAVAPLSPSKPTRHEAAGFLKTLYRREQLTRELDLEQLRYGQSYWESERSGPELAGLQRDREGMLRQLSAEANQVLADLFPGETGENIALTAFFDPDHAGPNLGFLSTASRQRFEAELLATEDRPVVDAALLCTLAEHILSDGEMTIYRQWNDPPAAALRNQLVTFHPTEDEFAAILRNVRATEDSTDDLGTGSDLERQLGSQRLTEFRKLKDPAIQTAVHDLYHLGLPLEYADWLAAIRMNAVESIQQIWRNNTLTDPAKTAQVAQLQRDYGRTIAARLALPASSLDELNPSL